MNPRVPGAARLSPRFQPATFGPWTHSCSAAAASATPPAYSLMATGTKSGKGSRRDTRALFDMQSNTIPVAGRSRKFRCWSEPSPSYAPNDRWHAGQLHQSSSVSQVGDATRRQGSPRDPPLSAPQSLDHGLSMADLVGVTNQLPRSLNADLQRRRKVLNESLHFLLDGREAAVRMPSPRSLKAACIRDPVEVVPEVQLSDERCFLQELLRPCP